MVAADVNLAAGWFTFPDPKMRVPVTIPLTKQTRAILMRRLAAAGATAPCSPGTTCASCTRRSMPASGATTIFAGCSSGPRAGSRSTRRSGDGSPTTGRAATRTTGTSSPTPTRCGRMRSGSPITSTDWPGVGFDIHGQEMQPTKTIASGSPDQWPDLLLIQMGITAPRLHDSLAWDSGGGNRSRASAAGFLRRIANEAHRLARDPAGRAASLRTIADYIEGKERWRRGPELPIDARLKINEAASNVEHHRPPGLTIDAAIDLHARFWRGNWADTTRQMQ